jgi:hypothetical protein
MAAGPNGGQVIRRLWRHHRSGSYSHRVRPPPHEHAELSSAASRADLAPALRRNEPRSSREHQRQRRRVPNKSGYAGPFLASRRDAQLADFRAQGEAGKVGPLPMQGPYGSPAPRPCILLLRLIAGDWKRGRRRGWGRLMIVIESVAASSPLVLNVRTGGISGVVAPRRGGVSRARRR